MKSTIPPGTTASMVASRLAPGFPLVSCPEFLREGSAIHDFNHPTRIVVGGDIMEAKNVVLNAIIHRARELSFGPSFVSTTIVSGELGANAAAAGAAILSSGAPGS